MELWELRRYLVAAAQGQQPPDLLLAGGQVVCVYSGQVRPANVAVWGDRICYVGPEAPAGPGTQVVDCRGRYLCPAFIESHTHPWLVASPAALSAFGAARGTLTWACDSLVFTGRMGGAAGLRRVIDACRILPGRFYWWVRISPNTRQSDDEGVPPDAEEALAWPEVVGTAEVTTWTQITAGDPALLRAMAWAHALGKRADGHTAGASPRRLAALAAAGVSGCHEAISAEEALERLRLGLWTLLRFQSLRPDLPHVAAGLARAGVDTHRLILTQDAPTPAFLAQHGAMDACVREAVAAGFPPIRAIQMATLNPATYLGLDHHLGGIAPGRLADILVLPDLESFLPEAVYLGGRLVAQEGRLLAPPPAGWEDAVLPPWQPPAPALLARPDLYRVPAPPGEAVPVARFVSTAITRRHDLTLPVRDGYLDLDGDPSLCAAVLLAADGQRVARAVVQGLCPGLEGLATSATSHGGLLVLGRSPQAMAQAAAAVAAMGGGVALVAGGQVVARLPLPYLGCMGRGGVSELAREYGALQAALQRLGYPYGDIHYSLDFLTADFLPDLRLTPRGLVEVKTGRVLVPPQDLAAEA